MVMVTIFTSPNCNGCRKVKAYLDEKGIPYEIKDISIDDNRERLIEMGFNSVPTTLFGEDIIVGFNKELLDSAIAKQN